MELKGYIHFSQKQIGEGHEGAMYYSETSLEVRHRRMVT
jgi:hypothetical protein